MDLASWAERRRAMRVPVRGVAVLHADAGPMHGTLENLSQTGALVNVASPPHELEGEVELRLADHSGWVSAHTVRVEQAHHQRTGWQIAVAFDRVDPAMRASIDAAIAAALNAARQRPVLVIDDQVERRAKLIDRLVDRGMTPLAPRTPLEVVDLLTRAQLHISLCLLAPGFGVPSTDLATILTDSFPWIEIADVTDDIESTVEHALAAWATTAVARLGVAMG